MNHAEQRQFQERVDRLIAAYFADPARRLKLAAGERLGERGDPNDRLYLVRTGRLDGIISTGDRNRREAFVFEPGDFLGIHSFFSRHYRMAFTVDAVTDCELAWMDGSQKPVDIDGCRNLDEQFMPIVVEALIRRQAMLQQMGERQEQVMRKLQEVEKLASLGQLAAGVAHELNNSLTVMALGTRWISEFLNEDIGRHRHVDRIFFDAGLQEGRRLSSNEVRERAAHFAKLLKLPDDEARMLARTGIAAEVLKAFPRPVLKRAAELHDLWELGATLHDMRLASSQAEHVVCSMKTLGAPTSERVPGVDINETIRTALALTRSNHKGMAVEVLLEDGLPPIVANPGELVQVWTNLVRNACDALQTANSPDPAIVIHSARRDGAIVVRVSDNGPGIPPEIYPYIFQPNVTTRKRGLSFGLGLGLTIVQRLVTDYRGTVRAENGERGAIFTVSLPAEPAPGPHESP